MSTPDRRRRVVRDGSAPARRSTAVRAVHPGTKADLQIKIADVERERGLYYSTAQSLTLEIHKLREANAKVVARAAELTVVNDALKAKIEWYKARCAELEAVRK